MTESDIVKTTLIAVSSVPGVRVWRNNSGAGYGVSDVQRALRLGSDRPWHAVSALRAARPVTYGVPGQADITGILPDGRRLEIECKTVGGKQSEQQKNFQKMIEAHNGVYLLVRDHSEARARVEDIVNGK